MVTALNSFKRQSQNAPLFSLKVSIVSMHHTLLLAIPSQNGIVSWCTSESQVFRLLLNTTRGNGIRKQALEVRWCPPRVVLPLEVSHSHHLSPFFSSQRILRSPAQYPLSSPHTKDSLPGHPCTTGLLLHSRWKASAKCITTAMTMTSPPSNPRCGASHPWMNPMRRSRNAPHTVIPGEPAILKLQHRDILCFQEGWV